MTFVSSARVPALERLKEERAGGERPNLGEGRPFRGKYIPGLPARHRQTGLTQIKHTGWRRSQRCEETLFANSHPGSLAPDARLPEQFPFPSRSESASCPSTPGGTTPRPKRLDQPHSEHVLGTHGFKHAASGADPDLPVTTTQSSTSDARLSHDNSHRARSVGSVSCPEAD